MVAVRSCLVTAGVEGGSLRRINKLPWQYVTELQDYWRKYPPVHVLLSNLARGIGLMKDTSKGVTEFEGKLMNIADHYGVRTTLPPSVAEWIKQVSTEEKHAN